MPCHTIGIQKILNGFLKGKKRKNEKELRSKEVVDF